MSATTIDKTDEHAEKKRFNILLVEDNPVDALVVQTQIEQLTDFRLQSVAILSEALERLDSENFDLILLDLNLPDALGLEGLIKLKHHAHKIPIMVLTGIDNSELGIMAMQRGAQDYLIKDADSHRLIKAIRYSIERMIVQDTETTLENHIVESGQNKIRSSGNDSRDYEMLTNRELQVLKLLGKGFNNQEIAECLMISMNTAKSHVASILHKLSVTDRSKAIIHAQNKGLI